MTAAWLEELSATARAAAEAAAVVAVSWRERTEALDVEEKAAPDDLVSQADREAEAAARAVLVRRRPDDSVVGEEGEDAPGTSGIRWVVDPIDGTTNYLYGRPDWAVSAAAVREDDGRILAGAVAEPALGRLAHARLGGGAWAGGQQLRCAGRSDIGRALVEINLGRPDQRPAAAAVLAALVPRVRDVRRGGSAAAALVQVADGRVDAYWGPGLQAWDGAAGLVIVTEAGGTVGDLAGPSGPIWPETGDVLASAPGLWPELQALLRPATCGPFSANERRAS